MIPTSILTTTIFAMLLTYDLAGGAAYYVKRDGDDLFDGESIEHAWKTCAKVNGSKFAPGDVILFSRGGEWGEPLVASSDGAAGNPITYDAFGDGNKPIFWGSE